MGYADIWNSHPKGYGKGTRECRICSVHRGLIRKYDLMVCRRCFRENANAIGFYKFR
ncbi:40S small subunit ribosomal protein uS14 (rpS29) [Andalucia godoyi]|uniref:40S small subunit ribosomal protein uS14 (RpS29) n=1 Tax=Andalucia godoyi TaxID=505711 RepID=A0A8K0AH29_ANDGO|nr:40S small subunit ribosomal protein uS14 (rpS29) [Andalucia godoyi]|eukprot:ANDGO_06607.mRNA.1 40S small subunit ribosomal protein uS14 (rpS29)